MQATLSILRSSRPEPSTGTARQAWSLVCRDLPRVAPGILDHGAPVAVRGIDRRLHGDGFRRERASVGHIGVFHIDVQEGGHRLAQTVTTTDEDHGITDSYLRWRSRADFRMCLKDVLQELNQAFPVPRDDSRRDRM